MLKLFTKLLIVLVILLPFFFFAFPRTQAVNAAPQCSDGIDNDGDGTFDYGNSVFNDRDCSSPDDTTETAQCRDGIDNDGDGAFDYGNSVFNDRDCSSPDDDSEAGPLGPECSNGLDDDGDGTFDYGNSVFNDPDCTSPADPLEQGSPSPTPEPRGECESEVKTGLLNVGESLKVTITAEKNGDFYIKVWQYGENVGGDITEVLKYTSPSQNINLNIDPNVLLNLINFTVPGSVFSSEGYYYVYGYQETSGEDHRCKAIRWNVEVIDVNLEDGKNPCDPNCETALGTINPTLVQFAGKIIRITFGLAGGIALILMVIGAVRVLTSSGDQQKLSGGREMITAALIGLLFLIFSVLILQFILENLFGFKVIPTLI